MSTISSTFDRARLARALIGFDPFFREIENRNAATNYPPYNVIELDEDNYRIEMAVTGFYESDLAIEVANQQLVITGNNPIEPNKQFKFVYHGLATRNFERRFTLAENMEVKSATVRNGLLTIDLHRMVPEYMKPKRIEINR